MNVSIPMMNRILLSFLVHKQKQVDRLVLIINPVLLLILENRVQLMYVDDDLQSDQQRYYTKHRLLLNLMNLFLVVHHLFFEVQLVKQQEQLMMVLE
jgi:hypothetical protein